MRYPLPRLVARLSRRCLLKQCGGLRRRHSRRYSVRRSAHVPAAFGSGWKNHELPRKRISLRAERCLLCSSPCWCCQTRTDSLSNVLPKLGGGRGTPGSRDLLVGAGPDHMAREVEAALAWLQHQGEQGQRLAKLASLRYLPERELSVAEQMRLLGLEPSADRTYRNWAQRLHDRMIAELSRRS